MILWAVAWATGFVVGVLNMVRQGADPMQDLRAYYLAGGRLNAGLPLYPAGVEIGDGDWYGYPPLLALVFRPLALLPFDLVRLGWAAVLGGAIGVALWQAGPLRVRTWVVFGVLLIPLGYGYMVGQAELLMIGLVALGSPLSIALAANVKLVPILFGVMWLWDREWSQLRRLALWCLGFGAVQVMLDPSSSLAFFDPGRFSLARSDGAWFDFDVSPWRVHPVVWLAVCAGLGLVASWRPLRRPAVIALVTFAAPRVLFYQLGMLVNVVHRPGLKAPAQGVQRGTIEHPASSLEGSMSPAGPRSGPLGGWPEPRAVLRRLRRPGAS